jgi:uncharacterized protein
MAETSLVVDCDSHVMEPADLWQNYLEKKYVDRAIRIESIDNRETLIIGETPVLSGVLAGLGGAHLPRNEVFSGKYNYQEGCPPASYDAAARDQLLDDWQVDYGVLFPTIGILPFPTEDLALSNAYCRAYNNWQKEAFESSTRVVPVAIINWHDVENAAAELETRIKQGFKGLFVPPETVAGKRPGDPSFDPIWQLCEESGIAACLHVIVRFGGAAVPFAAWGQTAPGPIFTFGLGATGQLIPAMATLVLDGLYDRFPKLKVVSVEAGCGYAAYLMDRLDEKSQFFADLLPNKLAMKPSDYIKRNCYFVAEPEERTIGAMLELVGKDKILWGSDYPHIDSTLEAPNLIRQYLSHLPETDQANVLGNNAAKLFQLD